MLHPSSRILIGCVLTMVLYAILQDMISVRLSREYFTVAHAPRLVPVEDATLMALGWGIRAGVGPGVLLGIVLALVSTAGTHPPLGWRDLRPGVTVLVLFMAWTTCLCGVAAGWIAHLGGIHLSGHWGAVIPPQNQALFVAVACAHVGSYASGIAGGIGLSVWAARLRAQRATENLIRPQSV